VAFATLSSSNRPYRFPVGGFRLDFPIAGDGNPVFSNTVFIGLVAQPFSIIFIFLSDGVFPYFISGATFLTFVLSD
jgi:hypothetical protein